MSKMPTKKKSCFQITSVTQAQVAAVGAADDTESLDDPDEPRTEDGSPEIFDVSRADHEPVCDRSSSEEVVNNVGETEAAGVKAQSQTPQAGQLSASSPSVDSRKVGVSASAQGVQQQPGPGSTSTLALITQPGSVQQQSAPTTIGGPGSVSVNASQPAAAAASTSAPLQTSCTSRFRVIKLDHGTGEPFRRGRWMCTEFYEKDSESSLSRTDSIRHANANLDPISDRDSGLGLTGGSTVSSATHSGQGLGSMLDTSLSSLPQQQQQVHHHSYSGRQQVVSASATQNVFSSGKPTAATAQQPTPGGNQPSGPPNSSLVGQNGLHQSSVHIHKSSVVPPSAHTITYPPQQTSQPSGLLQNQTEYYQQQQSGLPSSKSPLLSSLSVGTQPVGQGPPSAVASVSGGASVPSQIGDLPGAGGGSVSTGQIAQQSGGSAGTGFPTLVGGSTLQHQTGNQYTTYAQPQPSLRPAPSGVQNVPAFAVSSSVSTTVPTAVLSASSAAMPNVTSSSLPPGAVGVQVPPAATGQVEGGSGRKSVGLVNTHSPVISAKDSGKSLLPESLQLSNPTVSSLLGIHIPVDGDEDSASGANVVAIDNKIEQAMDLVKSHLMYAVREEVEVLKEQIKELYERNSVLERENAVLKSLANSEQLSQLSPPSAASSGTTPPQQGLSQAPAPTQTQLQLQPTPQQPHAQLQLDSAQQTQPSVTSA